MHNNKTSYFVPNIPNSRLEQMAYYEQKRKNEKNELIRTGIIIGLAILAYLFIQTAIAQTFLNGEVKRLFDESPIFNSCFSIITVHFCSVLLPFGAIALLLKKRFVSPLIPSEKLPIAKLFAWVSLGMCLCVLSNYFVSMIIMLCEKLGYELTKGETLEPNSILACVVAVFATAIVPGVIEEFAMRCCTLGVLKKYGKGFAVLTVSVVFGLLHGNVIQFVFAFLIGLVLGYVTIRTNNILPAILIHTFNNGISVLSDVANYIADKDISQTVVGAAYLMWLGLGAIGLIYLIFKKELLPKKKEKAPKEPYALSLGAKFACLIPGFSLPFFMLIVITVSTIKKI